MKQRITVGTIVIMTALSLGGCSSTSARFAKAASSTTAVVRDLGGLTEV